MITYKESLGILIFVGLLSNLSLADIAFKYSITPRNIQPGDHAELHLSVPLTVGESESAIEVKDDLLFENKEIQVLEKSSERTACCLELKYIITGYKDENFKLPPVEVKTLGNSFSTEALSFSVKSNRPPEDNDLREVFPAMSKPIPFLKWLRYLIEAISLVLLAAYLIKKVKGLRPPLKKVSSADPLIPVEDPHIWIRRQLSILKRKIEIDPTNEWLVDEWSDIVREFLFRKKALPALCWTTGEIKKTLSVDPFVVGVISSLEKCDSCKFDPKVKPREQIKQLVFSFISETEKTLSLCGIS